MVIIYITIIIEERERGIDDISVGGGVAAAAAC